MDSIELPTLQVTTGHSSFSLRVHAAAWSEHHGTGGYNAGLVLLSASGADTAIKAVRATLYAAEVHADFQLEQEGHAVRHLTRAALDSKPVGYQASVSKLAPGAVHLVALARIPGLMPDMRDEHLWAELSGPRYTTPILRSWIGWLKRTMIEDGKIVMATTYPENTSAGILQAEPDELDGMVSSGVRWGYLKMMKDEG